MAAEAGGRAEEEESSGAEIATEETSRSTRTRRPGYIETLWEEM